MTRDELLEECFGRSDLKPGAKILEMSEGRDVLAHVDLSFRRMVVTLPGMVGRDTILVAALANVCTAPVHRGKGYASALIRRAHAEASEAQGVRFAALYSDLTGFYERLGYRRVAPESHPNFMVAELKGETWPPGAFDPRGEW